MDKRMYCIVLCLVLYCTVLYCIVLYCIVSVYEWQEEWQIDTIYIYIYTLRTRAFCICWSIRLKALMLEWRWNMLILDTASRFDLVVRSHRSKGLLENNISTYQGLVDLLLLVTAEVLLFQCCCSTWCQHPLLDQSCWSSQKSMSSPLRLLGVGKSSCLSSTSWGLSAVESSSC